MLEANTAAVGNVKTDLGWSEKSPNVTNCSKILHSRSDSRVDPKTYSNWKSRTVSASLRLADRNTSQENVARKNFSTVYPGLEEKNCQLIPKLDNLGRLPKRIRYN